MNEITTIATALEDEFYNKEFTYSYSSLNKLLYDPQLFFKWYVLKQKEDKLDQHLIDGKLVHCLLLEKHNFENNFILVDFKVPSGNNKKIVEYIWKLNKGSDNLDIYEFEIIQWLTWNDLHQKLKDDKDPKASDYKTGDQKRIKKILTDENKKYLKFLYKSEGKNIVDKDTYDKCLETADKVKSNKEIYKLLKLDGAEDFEQIEVLNELKIDGYSDYFKCNIKGIIDNLVIDYKNEYVYINDVKTSGKTLLEFEDTVEYYKYWLQMAMYDELVEMYLKNKSINFNKLKIIHTFIVIDKYQNVYPFEVSKSSIEKWKHKTKVNVIDKAKYHYNEKNYSLPYEFLIKKIML